jgi:hypothetical protein
MKFPKAIALSVSTLALTALAFIIPASAAGAASSSLQPLYNPGTTMTVSGVISAVSEVPGGQPLEGVHVMVRSRNGNFDVYLGPRSFLSFLKTSFAAGDRIDVVGSRVTAGSADVILAREVYAGDAILTLRDSSGAEVWKNWGASAAVKST